MTEMVQSQEDRVQEVSRVAAEMFRQDPDWVTFFREVLGVDGVVRRLFPSSEEMKAFESAQEYFEIQTMVAKLRERTSPQNDSKEPTRVITVRLPKSLHESLRVEAHSRNTSMNKLCISKLLQVIDDELIPADATSGSSSSPAESPQGSEPAAPVMEMEEPSMPMSEPTGAELQFA